MLFIAIFFFFFFSQTLHVLFGSERVSVTMAEQATTVQVKERLERELGVPACRQRLFGRETRWSSSNEAQERGKELYSFDEKKEPSDETVLPDQSELLLRAELRGGCGVECCGCTW